MSSAVTAPQAIAARTVVAGRFSEGPPPGADVEILRALSSSPSKVMHRDAKGEHRETQLPAGLSPSPIRGTRCFFDLERSNPRLVSCLCPPDLPSLRIQRVNLYLSPPGTGAPLHFDVLSVIIVQLTGSKVWQVSPSPAVTQPAVNTVANEQAGTARYADQLLTLPNKMHVVHLFPGDWLFVPAGAWHGTAARRSSVSATLAVEDSTWLNTELERIAQTTPALPLIPRMLC